jgi:hypothetical protein
LKGRQAQGQQAQGEHNEDIKHIIKIDGLDESIAIIADPQSLFTKKTK